MSTWARAPVDSSGNPITTDHARLFRPRLLAAGAEGASSTPSTDDDGNSTSGSASGAAVGGIVVAQ